MRDGVEEADLERGLAGDQEWHVVVRERERTPVTGEKDRRAERRRRCHKLRCGTGIFFF